MSHITALSLDLDQVKAQFQAWRTGRIGRERIPEHLWAAALELLKHYHIGTVQRELRLNLNQLKKRSTSGQVATLSQQSFLEVNPADIAAIQPQAANYSGMERVCRIAFERSDGSRLTISLPADSTIIPAICANLLREWL